MNKAVSSYNSKPIITEKDNDTLLNVEISKEGIRFNR